jgi:hypothetical protein
MIFAAWEKLKEESLGSTFQCVRCGKTIFLSPSVMPPDQCPHCPEAPQYTMFWFLEEVLRRLAAIRNDQKNQVKFEGK